MAERVECEIGLGASRACRAQRSGAWRWTWLVCAACAAWSPARSHAQLSLQPGAPIAVLVPPPSSSPQGFGECLAMRDGTLAVGAPLYAAGVATGCVYVFEEVAGGAPTPTQQIVSPNAAQDGEHFGSSVALDGDTLVIGASQWDGPAGADQGRVSVYTRASKTAPWVYVQPLLSPAPGADRTFGFAVALAGDWLVIGEPNAPNGGAAYACERVNGSFGSPQTLPHPPLSMTAALGGSVAVSSSWIAIGAAHADQGAIDAGAVIVLERQGASWSAPLTVVSPLAASGSGFGVDVALGDDALAVGSYTASAGPILQAGRVELFKLDAATPTWAPLASFTTGVAAAKLGASLAIDETRVAAGALSYAAAGVDVGAAFTYDHCGAAWMQSAFATDSPGEAHEYYGIDVALRGQRLYVGAGNATVGGVAFTGKVFVYDVGSAPPHAPMAYCTSVNPGDTLRMLEPVCAGTALTCEVHVPCSPPSAGSRAVLGMSAASIQFPCGIKIPGWNLCAPAPAEGELLIGSPFQFAALPAFDGTHATTSKAIAVPPDAGLIGVHVFSQAVVIEATTLKLGLTEARDIEILL